MIRAKGPCWESVLANVSGLKVPSVGFVYVRAMGRFEPPVKTKEREPLTTMGNAWSFPNEKIFRL